MGSILLRTKYDPIYSDVRLLYPIILNVINMKVVLLAGGFGSRISEESQFKPKPMIEIGGMPILWHIMKEYAYYGHTEFIICAGYKQEHIKEWFANYFLYNSDVTFDYRNGKNEMTVHQTNMESWKVTVVDTGYNTMTGGRIKRIQEYVGNEPFLMTYGDGVCDVEIDKLIEFHKSHGKLATLTAVKMVQDKGVLDISENNSVRSFREKNASDGAPINAGYMVLEPQVFDLLDGDACVFEKTALVELANKGELMSYITMTGGRIKRIQEYVGNEPFLMTYGDGVCDVEIDKLIEFHKSHGKLATLTAVKMVQDKGVLDISENNSVRSFREKNASDGAPINAGYMVLEPQVFDLLDGDACVFEKTALVELANKGELMSYIHEGFWQCMDNIREKNMLENLLDQDKAPWKRWDRQVPSIEARKVTGNI